MHRPRRVMRREIQRLEVVVVVLDLRAIGALVAEPREDADDAIQRARDRMQAAAPILAAGQADVDAFGRERAAWRRRFAATAARIDRVG